MQIVSRPARFFLSCLAALAMACGSDSSGGGGTTTPPDNSVARVDISPSAPMALASGGTATLAATAFTKSNQSLGSANVAWSSSNDQVASVVGGVVTAKLVGTATITAAVGSVTSVGVTMTVTPGAAAQLGLRAQPGGAAAGVPFTTQPVIEVRDAAGNLVSTPSVVVTAGLASGGGGLAGTTTATAVSGVATFNDLTITGLVGPRTLTFTATGLAAATSSSFTLAPGPPSTLAIRTQPVAGTAYAPFTVPAAVELRDLAGNVANSTASVTATITSGGGTLGGTATVAAVAGVATFTDLTVNGAAGARTLTFASGPLAAVTSTSFNVAAAPPAVIALSSTTTDNRRHDDDQPGAGERQRHQHGRVSADEPSRPEHHLQSTSPERMARRRVPVGH